MKSRSIKSSTTGFTLIEVLIALAVIAIALGAILNTSGTQAYQASYLKQKTIAHWVAMNEMTKLQIEAKWPSTGEITGSTKMANHEWFWKRTVIETVNKDIRQVELRVFSDKKYNNNLTQLIIFLAQPQ